jgi:two-component sensor histidine kinase
MRRGQGDGGDRWRRIVRRRLARGLEPDSLRARLLIATGLALAPVVIFASAMALHQAQVTQGFAGTAAWATAAALPLLLGVAAVLAVAIASETLILRWLLYFERVARAYGRGRYSVRPRNIERAPAEFRTLGSAVQDMAVAVEERDRALRKALDSQTMLLREVHHRVKNNLQIVGSLLSLQANRADDQKVRDALMDALVRIDAMSLAQRFMQEDEETGSISSGQLFQAWASQIRARLGKGADRGLRLRLDVQERPLSLDLAAPMALIATEALMQAYRRPCPKPLSCRLKVAMHEHEDVVLTICVEEDLHAFDATGGIGLTLIEGYVRQIRGRLDLVEDTGRLIVHAPIPAAA